MESLISVYERWAEIPRWQKWLIIMSIASVLFLTLYFLRITPLSEQLAVEKKKLESLSLTVSKLKIVRKKRRKLEKEVNNLKKELVSIETKLPAGREDVSKIIRSISRADSGVTVVSIKRGSPVSKKYYVEVPYNIELESTYPQFVHWCEKLSKSDRIINFGNLSIRANRSGSGKGMGNYTISVNLQIKAFNLKR
jgi:type IV pilus assembly protein PilO